MKYRIAALLIPAPFPRRESAAESAAKDLDLSKLRPAASATVVFTRGTRER